MRPWMVLFLLAQAVARSTPAAAASLSVAPEAPCLDAAELTALVERELGGALDAAVPLRFELSGAKRPHGYSARLDVFDDRGAAARRRVVEAADCATLQDTVAVAMTLALSADTGAAEPVPVRGLPEAANASDSANVAATRDASLDVASAPAVTARQNLAWVPSLSAGLLVDAGTLPSASLGASVGAALEVGRFQIQALGTLLFDREVSIEGRLSPDAGATLGFAGASLLACTPLFQTTSGRLSSRGCLGWELGQLSGEGRGVARPERGRVLWSAPRLDIGGRFALPVPFGGVGVSLAAEAPLNRDDFTLGPDVVVHRPPVIVARAAVGVDLAFE
jgi:hypothetical protein